MKDKKREYNLSCLFVDSNRKANQALKPKSGKLSKQGLGSRRADVLEPLRRDRIGPFCVGPKRSSVGRRPVLLS